MNISIIGLTITSSWGNGHATSYRSLIKGLHKAGHDVFFYERNVPWYESQRDLVHSANCEIIIYNSVEELKETKDQILQSDLIMVGSYVPEGVAIGDWVVKNARGIKAFYDLDTPVTLADLQKGKCTYITEDLIPEYDIYLSLSAGPTLDILEKKYGSPRAVVFPCSVDEEVYFPDRQEMKWDLGYLGTYSKDRQIPLEELMLKAALHWREGKFVVAGSLYPEDVRWPANVDRIEHLAPENHREFYNQQRFTLNITRKNMVDSGYSPSVRIFEAAACGVPIISDSWQGIEQFLEPGKEILITGSYQTTLDFLNSLSEGILQDIGLRARERILREHTSLHRAKQLESYFKEVQYT